MVRADRVLPPWRRGHARLGQEDRRGAAFSDLEVGPDGTIWRTVAHALYAFDGATWTDRSGPVREETIAVEVLEDGTVWAATLPGGNGKATVGRLTPAGWEWRALPDAVRGITTGGNIYEAFAVSQAEGDLWLSSWDHLNRDDGSGWLVQGELESMLAFDVGPDGTLWGYGENYLARLDGAVWESFDQSDGILEIGNEAPPRWVGFFEVAPDGSVWVESPTSAGSRAIQFAAFPDEAMKEAATCDGIVNFDGRSLSHYLRGLCIYAMDVAPDGSVSELLRAGSTTRRDAVRSHRGVRDPLGWCRTGVGVTP